MCYNLESDKDNYFQENYTPNENILTIQEFSLSEKIFNDEEQKFSNYISNKDDDSESIQNDIYLIPRNCKINQNYYNISPKKTIFNPIENDLKLKTEILGETSPSTNKIFNLQIKNLNEEKIEKPKNENKHNIIRKSKKVIFDTALIFINNIIYLVYNGNIGHGIFKKELKKINPKENKNTVVTHNRNILNKSLKDIFSNNISVKYTGIRSDYNKVIIEQLLNEKNEVIKKIFTDLFSKTVLDFISMLKEPNGELKEIYENNLLKSTKKDKESLNEIINIINNYKNEFQRMKVRKKDDIK